MGRAEDDIAVSVRQAVKGEDSALDKTLQYT